MHKRPGNAVSPSGLWPFSAVSRNAFRPGEPRNGPESRFFFKDPIFIWEKGNLGALGSPGASLLLGDHTKVNAPFRPKKRPVSGGRRETPNFRLRPHQYFGCLPLEIIRIDEKWPATAHFLLKISFHLPTKPCSRGWWYESAILMYNSLRRSAGWINITLQEKTQS